MNYEIHDDDDHVTVGPWGGQSGARWDDGVFSGVRQVVISYGAAIDSILIEYDKKGCSVWSDKHGGSSGFKTNKVKFNYPEEFLVSISGYYGSITDYGPVLVRSLVFESNKKKYGPFGLQQGTHFSFPMSGGMVVGFHGRSSWSLESIGVHLKPLLIQNPPDNFSFSAPQNYASNEIPAEKPGGFGMAAPIENQESIFVLKDKVGDDFKIHPPEILIHKSGYSGSNILRGTTVVKSVTIHRKGLFADGVAAHVIEKKPSLPHPFTDSFNMNDKKISRSFNDSFNMNDRNDIFNINDRKISRTFNDSFNMNDRNESFNMNNKKISRPFNDSFNMNDRKISRPLDDSFNIHDRKTSQVFPGMAKEPAWFSSGPWGGNGGKLWDDGIFSGVKKIYLFKGEAIYSIQIEYDRNGQSVMSTRHGGGIEGSSHMIAFQNPLEVLTSFCGYYESLTGDEGANVIKSLTFFTNKGKYGPIGEESGTFFTSSKIEGKIVGFHGKSGCYLNAIGVHMQVQR